MSTLSSTLSSAYHAGIVRVWCRYCAGMVRVWCGYGAGMGRVWCGYGASTVYEYQGAVLFTDNGVRTITVPKIIYTDP